MGKDRPISRKAQKYLRAFDAWLPLRTRSRTNVDDKTEAFDAMMDGIVPTVEEELANAEPCAWCGGPILRAQSAHATRTVFCCEDCHHSAGNAER